MRKKELLNLGEASLLPNGKYKLPQYKRAYSEKEALERIAKDYGAKSYRELQGAQREKRFKDYAKRMDRAGIKRDKEYFQDYLGIRKAVKSGKKVKEAYSKVVLRLAETERQQWRIGETNPK